MIPRERSLVKSLENQPFALLGINSDSEARFRAAVKDGNITWPNWFDGGGTGGPIATQWNVHLWPTLYVLDPQGVIRYVGHGAGLDEAVASLLKASGGAPAPSPKPGD